LYKTYDNQQISAINMQKEDLYISNIIRYSLIKEEQINIQN